jgi:hypothetical protein
MTKIFPETTYPNVYKICFQSSMNNFIANADYHTYFQAMSMVSAHLFMKCYHGRYIFHFQDNVDSIWSTVHEMLPCSRSSVPLQFGWKSRSVCCFSLNVRWRLWFFSSWHLCPSFSWIVFHNATLNSFRGSTLQHVQGSTMVRTTSTMSTPVSETTNIWIINSCTTIFLQTCTGVHCSRIYCGKNQMVLLWFYYEIMNH